MDVTTTAALNGLYKTTNNQSSIKQANQTSVSNNSFDQVLAGAMQMVDDTNTLQNNASAEAISFALGETDNVHDLLIAEKKQIWHCSIQWQFVTSLFPVTTQL